MIKALSQNYKVLIVDMDNQGNIALSFGKNPDEFQTTIYDVLVSGEDPRKAIVPVHDNIDILPGNYDMTFYEHDIFTNMSKYPDVYQLLRNAMKSIENEYDFMDVSRVKKRKPRYINVVR